MPRYRRGLLVYAMCFQIHSVQKTGFWCTEWKFGAKKRLLVYATRFQRLSVQKTSFWCTEWKFGAQNSPLVYAFSEALCTANALLCSNGRGLRAGATFEVTFAVVV